MICHSSSATNSPTLTNSSPNSLGCILSKRSNPYTYCISCLSACDCHSLFLLLSASLVPSTLAPVLLWIIPIFLHKGSRNLVCLYLTRAPFNLTRDLHKHFCDWKRQWVKCSFVSNWTRVLYKISIEGN